MEQSTLPHVVIIGGGFCGLYLTKKLGGKPFKVTLIDRRNVHLFQPLLYQVATGGLSPGDITSPLRGILAAYKNINVLMGEVTDILPETSEIVLDGGDRLAYDDLIIAAGAENFFFGNDPWEKYAPGLKSVEDALEIRRRILLAFEGAERQGRSDVDEGWLTFVIVGGGPTGVELAGAIGELAHRTLKNNFRNFDPANTRIVLLQGGDKILENYPDALIGDCVSHLEALGVEVRTNCQVTHIAKDYLVFQENGQPQKLATRTALWAAGVKPSQISVMVADRTGAEKTPRGQIKVDAALRIPGHDHIFVGGDLAYVLNPDGRAVPGVAPAAMQMGHYIGESLLRQQRGKSIQPFTYKDKGSLAVIGRFAAVAHVGRLNLRGLPAWLTWALVHIFYLIEFDNKVIVLFQWASDFLTKKRGARFISGDQSFREISRKGEAGS